MANAIEASGLTKRYGEVTALVEHSHVPGLIGHLFGARDHAEEGIVPGAAALAEETVRQTLALLQGERDRLESAGARLVKKAGRARRIDQ